MEEGELVTFVGDDTDFSALTHKSPTYLTVCPHMAIGTHFHSSATMAMAAPSISLSFFLFLSLHFTSSFSKFPLPFPSSLLLRPQTPQIDSLPHYHTKFFTQTLDHFNFNPQSYHTFQQRYLINDSFWGGAAENAPIFVYTGNEGNIEWFAHNTGFLLQSAPHFRALVVFIEVYHPISI